MKFTARRKAKDASHPPEQDLDTPDRRPKKRRLRRAGITALALLAVVAVSTSVNLVLMEKRERSAITPYGERVPVAGGAMNVWRNGHPGPTIVLLSGLGTAAPALDFAPLVRELDGYNVIVVEGFGYGYSDMEARPRTVENITAELHEVLSKLKVEKPYVLVGHSISGFYTCRTPVAIPKEVSAVVGIDPTVPAAKASAPAGRRRHQLGTRAGDDRGGARGDHGRSEPCGAHERRVHGGRARTHTPHDDVELRQPGPRGRDRRESEATPRRCEGSPTRTRCRFSTCSPRTA